MKDWIQRRSGQGHLSQPYDHNVNELSHLGPEPNIYQSFTGGTLLLLDRDAARTTITTEIHGTSGNSFYAKTFN